VIIQDQSVHTCAYHFSIAVSVKEIQAAIKEMPQYQKTLKTMGIHVNLASRCLEQYKRGKLHDISQLEQVSTIPSCFSVAELCYPDH